MWTKKVTVSYYRVEAAEEDYFSNFHDNAQTMLTSGNRSSSFESGEVKYQWELLESVEMDESISYIFSVVKERYNWPVWLTEEGERTELALPNGGLGDIAYGLINPAYNFLICFAAGAGGSMSQFKKLLGQFSPEGVVRLNPIFEEMVDEKVMNWDSYKRVSIGMNMPSGDDVTGFSSTKAGELVKLLEHLGGLKLDITVSAGGGKETLSAMQVKDLIPELLSNDLCTSLTVRGSDFDNGKPEQFDLKNAQIKYTEQMEIEGNYVTDSDAKNILMRAINERASLLFSKNS